MARTHETLPGDSELFGWRIRFDRNHRGQPFAEMSKEGFLLVGERGEVGIDPEILLQRLIPRAFEQEVDRATPSHRGLWEERVQEALDAREDARAMRRERVLREQDRRARQREALLTKEKE